MYSQWNNKFMFNWTENKLTNIMLHNNFSNQILEFFSIFFSIFNFFTSRCRLRSGPSLSLFSHSQHKLISRPSRPPRTTRPTGTARPTTKRRKSSTNYVIITAFGSSPSRTFDAFTNLSVCRSRRSCQPALHSRGALSYASNASLCVDIDNSLEFDCKKCLFSSN